ncbi:nuclear transport factor 2 family protein [Psychrobacter sp. FDAARGOS_221]|uniref:nuclear transport factor 2 family protein n=1 Tax=Psychrobacter sp. FDAARGOS_221 TaxID=1975705 RepID=UPI000BB59BDA|nr:nuclear transport factor 2 family protein [Psychrobacter sp. FDAARGOS_221]PNK59488.1 nuclear transport factor 2 family protein [Psychrobacter sp. FDAARGOS_221]
MKQMINELEQQRFDYLINKQYDQFEKLCDPQLRYVHSSGKIDDLTSYMYKLRHGYYNYQDIRFDIDNVIDMGEYVMATGDLHLKLLAEDKPLSLQNKAISIWRKHEDGYKFLMYQGTAF